MSTHDTELYTQADADDEPLIKAILSGARKRYATLGDLPILIHTVSIVVIRELAIECDLRSPAPAP